MRTTFPARDAFTLVEILIVVVILGILAAIVLPQFTSAADEARANSVKMDLYRIRQQLEVFKTEHNGNPPSLAHFSDEFTMATNISRTTAAPGTEGFPYGPYVPYIPINPFTRTNDVTDQAAGADHAWYYDETLGTFLANGSDEQRQW